MKQLKITIAGEVKTFDLPENGEYKCEVTESYVPTEGDCVMVETKDENISYWCKLTSVTSTTADFKISVNSSLKISKKGFFGINEYRIYTKITPEELKAKYAEAGYDWDYATDTIKPIKWMPKEGDEVWFLLGDLSLANDFYNDFYSYELEKGLLFQTKEECQKFAEHCLKYFDKK